MNAHDNKGKFWLCFVLYLYFFWYSKKAKFDLVLDSDTISALLATNDSRHAHIRAAFHTESLSVFWKYSWQYWQQITFSVPTLSPSPNWLLLVSCYMSQEPFTHSFLFGSMLPVCLYWLCFEFHFCHQIRKTTNLAQTCEAWKGKCVNCPVRNNAPLDVF